MTQTDAMTARGVDEVPELGDRYAVPVDDVPAGGRVQALPSAGLAGFVSPEMIDQMAADAVAQARSGGLNLTGGAGCCRS